MNDIKAHKRQQPPVTPTSVLNEPLEEIKEEKNIQRKEVKEKILLNVPVLQAFLSALKTMFTPNSKGHRLFDCLK